MPTQIQFKRGTAASMAALNLTLAAGEPGLETDTRKLKIGDGVTAWNSLRYATDPLVNTPTALSADQNNYVLPATADIFRFTASTPITISGIAAGYDGQKELLVNVGSNAITLAHNSSNSSAGNRFATLWAGNFTLSPGGAARIVYDATSAVWRIDTAPVHSVDGLTGIVTITKAQIFEFTTTSAPATATGSNGNYTWSLPAGAKLVEFFMVGGGGGGGSGRRAAAGNIRYGGGGGASGGVVQTTVMASLIQTALSVVVGVGGAGGAAQTTDDTNGNNGGNGNSSTITFNSSSSAVFTAELGLGGSGGTASAGTAGSAVSNRIVTFRGVSGQAAALSNLSGFPGSISATGNTVLGGTAGGSLDGAGNIFTPGAVTLPTTFFAATSQIGANASGGAASITAAAGAGSNGVGHGYGGCGGGASQNTFNSGAGGNGANGYVRITVWY